MIVPVAGKRSLRVSIRGARVGEFLETMRLYTDHGTRNGVLLRLSGSVVEAADTGDPGRSDGVDPS